jgi:hypothetical protein
MNNSILPEWMIYAGSAAGLLWAILQILGWLNKLFHFPKLEIRLTKEVFFRLIEDGETIFTNAVFIARHGPIEITNVRFRLARISGSQKVYTFSPKNIGNKVANPPSPYAANNFWTKSCKMFLVENVPTHILFLSALEEYSTAFKNVTEDFSTKVTNYQADLQTKLSEIQENEQEYLQKINNELSSIETEACTSLIKFVQLEPGTYELIAEVQYSRIGVKILKSNAETTSKITFSVDNAFVESYKRQLIRFLETASRNIVFNRTDNYTYPEYQPNDIVEN